MHGLLPLEEVVVLIMMPEPTMVLVEQVEQPLEATVVLSTVRVVVMVKVEHNLQVVKVVLEAHQPIMVLMEQLF